MRRKLIIATTAGALTLGGLAVAVPATAGSDAAGTSAVERITEALSGLVSDGSLTQEQADEVAGRLSEAGFGGPGGHGGGHGGGRTGGHLDLAAAATALDMPEEELRTALEADGTSLADVAEEQGVAVDALVDALVTAAREDLAAAVEDGGLTQEQADERLAALEERVTERVSSDAPGPGRGPGGLADRDAGGSTDD
jgi:lambda repressor-like predicted transcriptional regulator